MYAKEEKARYMREYYRRNLEKIRAKHRIYMVKYRLRKKGIIAKSVKKSLIIPVSELKIASESNQRLLNDE